MEVLTDRQVKKLLSATDEDITKAIDTLVAHPNCTGPTRQTVRQREVTH